MTAQQIQGLWLCLTLSTACVVLCPTLWWLLPNRSEVV